MHILNNKKTFFFEHSNCDNFGTDETKNGNSDMKNKRSSSLPKQSGFKLSNQDFKFRCFGGKYQDLFFQSGFRDTADFFKQNKQ